jgi:LysR family hydrogen peroxide-inducible transcriptional activator
MDTRQLRYFVATAETGSVSRAAARCGVAQPSLSLALRKLEESLGTPLFDRTPRGMCPTDAGRALLPRARRILAEIESIESGLTADVEAGAGSLALGAIPTIAPYVVPAALAALRSEMPACRVTLREDYTENLVEALAAGEIDCALASTPLEDDRLDVEVLAQEELLVAVPAGHASATRPFITLADLRGQPAIALDEAHCLGRQIQGFCASRGVSPTIVCRTAQLATVFELVAAGMGVSIVPECAAAAYGQSRWRYLHLRQSRPTRQLAVAWRRGRTRPRAAARLVASLPNVLKALRAPASSEPHA